MVSIADCERTQTAWFRAQTEATGGGVWTDGGMVWTDGPDGLNVMFPDALDEAALRRGVRHARESGRGIVGAWLGLEVDPAPLLDTGFQRGWSPWWMTADLAEVPEVADERVHLELDNADYPDEHAAYRERLALVRQRPARAWYAAARQDGRFAGHAWSLRDGELAGIFDMEVWPSFQRRGLGTGLLSAVCAAAREAGARHAVLNATPEGKQLYARHGFRQIGEGITYWHHLAP